MFYFKNVGRDLTVFVVVGIVFSNLDNEKPQLWLLPVLVLYFLLGFLIGFYKKIQQRKNKPPKT